MRRKGRWQTALLLFFCLPNAFDIQQTSAESTDMDLGCSVSASTPYYIAVSWLCRCSDVCLCGAVCTVVVWWAKGHYPPDSKDSVLLCSTLFHFIVCLGAVFLAALLHFLFVAGGQFLTAERYRRAARNVPPTCHCWLEEMLWCLMWLYNLDTRRADYPECRRASPLPSSPLCNPGIIKRD